MIAAGAVRDQADAVLAVLAKTLGSGVTRGVYLYGSAVVGGLRPDSDLDLFGVIGRRLIAAEKRALVEGLTPISGCATRLPSWRPIELTLAVQDELRPWRYPPRFDFQYGEWLREEFQRGDFEPWPDANPDVAVLVTMVLGSAVPLIGPPARELLDPVPREDIVRAMVDEIPQLLDDLESDTRNVLLTLARIWTTTATGDVVSKDAAAAWVVARLPGEHRPVLELASAAYIGEADDRGYSVRDVRSHAELLVREIRRARVITSAR